MAQRICPNCGHVENEYTFFCTECGEKTIVSSDAAEKNNDNQMIIKPLIQPQNSDDLNTQINQQLTEESIESYASIPTDVELYDTAEDSNPDGSINTQYVEMGMAVKNAQNSTKPNGVEWKKRHTYVAIAGVIVLVIVIAVLVNNNKSYDETMSYSDDIYDEDYGDEEIDYEEEYEDDASSSMDEDEWALDTYILPGSDSRYIDKSELYGFSAEECRLARNELYARHGRKFDDEALQAYFDSKDWYKGEIAPTDFSEDMLNEYEIYNRDLIVEFEEEEGYR